MILLHRGYSFTLVGYLPWLFAVRICREYLPQLFGVAICRGNLPWLIAVSICRSFLPWEFAAAICRGNVPWLFAVKVYFDYLPRDFYTCKQILFCIWEQILFIWKQTFFRCEQNFFIREIFFINDIPFCYCRDSYGPPFKIKERKLKTKTEYSGRHTAGFADILFNVKSSIKSFSREK